MRQTVVMGRIERIERQVESLTPEELAEFREWFAEFDWHRWDDELEEDVAAGRLDELADEALRDHQAGRTKRL